MKPAADPRPRWTLAAETAARISRALAAGEGVLLIDLAMMDGLLRGLRASEAPLGVTEAGEFLGLARTLADASAGGAEREAAAKRLEGAAGQLLAELSAGIRRHWQDRDD